MFSGIVMALLAIVLALLVFRGLVSCSLGPSTTATVNASWAAPGTGTSTLSSNGRQDTLTFNGTKLTFGTGTNQINLLVEQDRTLAASSNETLDLYGHTTPLVGVDGTNQLFLHIKYILIFILPGTGDISGLTIGGAGSNPWVAGGAMGGTTPTVTIYPNGTSWQLGEPTAGFAVSSGAGQLKITNNSSAVPCNYRLVIGGTTT